MKSLTPRITGPHTLSAAAFLPALLALMILAACPTLAGDDPAATMEAGRTALNKGRFREAAEFYRQVHESAREDDLAGNALYWEAFARYRLDRVEELKEAATLLAQQAELYPDVETATDGEALLARIYGELAQRGEADAARKVRELSEEQVRAETQMAALHALMEMDPDKALPVLENIVTGKKKTSDEMRRNAVFMLCRYGEERSLDLLIKLLHESEDAELQSELVMCLSMTESEKALDAIVDFFGTTGDPELGEAALFAIGRHGGDKAFLMLADIVKDTTRDPRMRRQALFGLGNTGRDDDVAALAAGIIETETDPEMREMALFSLSDLDSEMADRVILDLIRNPAADDELRAQALFFASEREKVSLDMVRELYAGTDSRDLKQQICHVLTQMDDEEAALGLLIEIVGMEKDPEIKRDAVFWVSQFDDPRAAEFLLEIINEE
ncbi:MAG: HEAT repeat domain-containing protein [Candidatus Krumholzibacteriia bacterium]